MNPPENQRDTLGVVADSYRRFGLYGPAYRVRAVRPQIAGETQVDIEVLESGETLTLPLGEVASCPLAE